MLKPHTTSCPARLPVDHFYFTIRDEDNQTIKFFTQSFGAEYAAHYWITSIMEHPARQNWKSTNTLILIASNGYTLTVKGSDLEAAIEYKPTKEESQWTPPEPELTSLRRLENFETTSSPTTYSPPEEQKPTKPTVAPRHRSQKPSPKGTITVAALCAEYQIQPNKGRQLLRKAKIKKPSIGWTFKETDPALIMIREVLSKG